MKWPLLVHILDGQNKKCVMFFVVVVCFILVLQKGKTKEEKTARALSEVSFPNQHSAWSSSDSSGMETDL